MSKCLSPERGERAERLYFRDGLRSMAQKLLDEPCVEAENFALYRATAFKVVVMPDQGHVYKHRLLGAALKREASRRRLLNG